jgi:peptidyl-prolyl cis-trans isomerase SurA
MRFFVFAFLTLIAFEKAWAPIESRIMFVVGDRPVFSKEFNDRLSFIMLIMGNDPQKVEKTDALIALIMKGMVDEILQLNAAEKAGIRISDRAVEAGLERLARGNGMTRADLATMFAKNNVPLGILKNQIKTQIAWGQYIQQKYLRDMIPSQNEVERHMQRLKAQQGKTEYRLAEIVVYAHGRSKADIFPKIEQVMQLIQQGAPFPMVARQFSESRSSVEGGYLGWLQTEDLDPVAASILAQTNPGSMTPPIETASGYSLFVVLDKRQNTGKISLSDVENTLQQGHFELASKKELARLRRATMIQYR